MPLACAAYVYSHMAWASITKSGVLDLMDGRSKG